MHDISRRYVTQPQKGSQKGDMEWAGQEAKTDREVARPPGLGVVDAA